MTKISDSQIIDALVDYVLANYASPFDRQTLPRDQSLVEIGVLDSYGVVELVSFMEGHWHIQILDAEITREKMGSIIKMAQLVAQKL